MSAREALASSIMFLSKEKRDAEASYIMRRLAAKGYRILGPGELDAETLERAAKVVETHHVEFTAIEGYMRGKLSSAIRALKGDGNEADGLGNCSTPAG